MIWAQKLAKRNTTAATWMRQARQKAANPDMKREGQMIFFLNKMGLGEPDPSNYRAGSIVQMISVNGLIERNLTIGDNETNGKLVSRPTNKQEFSFPYRISYSY